MACLEIIGGEKLYGEAFIQGSKNAVLPILAACILCKEENCIKRCPNIRDTSYMFQLLEMLGGSVRKENEHICINISNITKNDLQLDIAKEMRASVLLVGPVLARTGAVCFSQPGGCVIGKRPIDLHLYVLKQLNVEILQKDGYILGRSKGLKGGKIYLPFPSVGATEQGILTAVLAIGNTYIENAARDPEIIALCHFLRSMGAKITGDGTNRIYIQGVKQLHGIEYSIMADRIVAETYLAMVGACQGEITMHLDCTDQMEIVLKYMEEMGMKLYRDDNQLHCIATERLYNIPYIKTAIYPGFPTDMQSVFLALMATGIGTSCLEETIFESRFGCAMELKKMGALIEVVENKAIVSGSKLKGNKVFARDLRGGAALITAALAATGKSVVENIEYVERGYDTFVTDLKKLGAKVERSKSVKGNTEYKETEIRQWEIE